MEIADIAQISVFGFPKADPEAPLIKWVSEQLTKQNQSLCALVTTLSLSRNYRLHERPQT
jgi:CO dehydrogenase/acetyl-CoA synthase alpha subunit